MVGKGRWMLWLAVDDNDPFKYFKNKYNQDVVEIVIGDNVKINVPDGVTVNTGFKAQKNHVLLRGKEAV